MYYLQSRYYDPEIGRFINADALASTGQGLLSNNMFAYCENNPVTRGDHTGCFWRAILIAVACVIALVGCANQDVGAAPDYHEIAAASTDSNESALRKTNPNCYSYAIGIYDRSYNPGDFSNTKISCSVESVGAAVIKDFQEMGRSIRVLESATDSIKDNEYRIALRVSDYDENRSIVWDYHFMVQTSSGQWAEKHGPGGATVLHESGTPDTISWDCGPYQGFYTSSIVYFAISSPN